MESPNAEGLLNCGSWETTKQCNHTNCKKRRSTVYYKETQERKILDAV